MANVSIGESRLPGNGAPLASQTQPMNLAIEQCEISRPPLVSSMRFERIDTLTGAELDRLREFPTSAAEFFSQSRPTLPISADPELFSRSNITFLKEFVELQVGEIDLSLWNARCSLHRPGEGEIANLPVHTLTQFTYRGMRFAGPLVGSFANPLLRFGRELPDSVIIPLVVQLVEGINRAEHFDGIVVAFRPPRHHAGAALLDTTELPARNSFRIFTEHLGYTSFQFAQYLDGSPGDNPENFLFYGAVDPELLHDRGFMTILRAVREVRQHELSNFEQSRDFARANEHREAIRRAVVEHLVRLWQATPL